MHAVILSGGKQYRVQEGDVLKLESLPVEVGVSYDFDQILMVGTEGNIKTGRPYLDGCKVSAKVLSQGRHDKIRIVKFGRRKHREKWQGHRQNFTEVQITKIKG